MKLKIKVNLANEGGESFMGEGLEELLRRIQRTGSIHQAAGEMELSYAKALKILNRLEENLPGPVLERSRGGRERGGTTLTGLGKRLLEEYGILRDRIGAYGVGRFAVFQLRIGGGEVGERRKTSPGSGSPPRG